MAAPQVFLHPKLPLDYFYARYFDKKSFPLPPGSGSMSNSLLIKMGKGKKLGTSNQSHRQTVAFNELSLINAKHEMCSSEATLISDGRRSSGVVEATSTSLKNIESTVAGSISVMSPCKGLGIVDFMKNKNFLITGATGFVGKVLIEKILRMQPDIGKLFLIIRANDSAAALKRLKDEVMNVELFKCLREIHGDEFEKFMLKRLVPVAGDMTKHNLGIEEDMANVLMEEVDIIVSSAATTTFDERYDVALQTNTTGVDSLLQFGKCCENLQLFIHISTAYVHGQRQGRALEKPFQMHGIANQKAEFIPPLNFQAEFHLANKVREGLEIEFSNFQRCNKGLVDSQRKITQRMQDLGMERARAYGWQDTYAFTKAMAEMLMVSGRENLPVVIVRPSVIESTYSQPFPGWIEGHRMLDPIITLYGKGQLSCLLADSDTLLDLVPVDMVVNATLAAMAKHAGKPGLKVYQVASSVANPIRVGKVINIIFEHFKCNPYIDNKEKPIRLMKAITCVHTMEDFCGHDWDTSPSSKDGLSSSIEQLKYMAKIYEPYGFYKGRFDNSNLEKLFQELSEEEQEIFGFDVKNIEWKNYIGNIHIMGLRRHVMKGRGSGKSMINISSD
eukprot:PITA_04114